MHNSTTTSQLKLSFKGIDMANSAKHDEETLKSTKAPLNWRNLFTCVFIAFSTGIFSYLAGIVGSTLAKPSFALYMHLVDAEGHLTDGANSKIGATAGAFNVS